MSETVVQRTMLDVFAGLPIVPVPGVVETSKAAAESVQHATGAIRQRILSFLLNRGDHGATCDEIVHLLKIEVQTVTPRLNELRNSGLVEKTDTTRLTRRLRKATVQRLTSLGIQLAAMPVPGDDQSRGSKP